MRWPFLVVFAIFFFLGYSEVCAYSVNPYQAQLAHQNAFGDRFGYDKRMTYDDPRSLFKAIYGYNKRVHTKRRALITDVVNKRRGLRDPLDPRNLFRAIYGFK